MNEDPLISAMTIERVLPLHESSRRLRELYPQCPRVYGVAVLGGAPLVAPVIGTEHRPDEVDVRRSRDRHRLPKRRKQLAATLVHTVIGGVVALVVLEAKAWDTGEGCSDPRSLDTASPVHHAQGARWCRRGCVSL